jgi:hypothetical protein
MSKSETVLVLGASDNPARYSYLATRMLLDYGYRVWLTGRRAGEVLGHRITTSFPQTGTIDTVTLYVGPDNQGDFMQPVEQLKPRRVLFNPGTENPEWQEKLNAIGIETENACTLVLLSSGQF